ncbi:chalcone isomerase family protein [Pelomonas sp. SE-A7]|uniref:chalcone isomerase family protein n=1 Tax=Pelomonas sp. SE-A7 TaxID=3054953 RepID=UPI00259CCE3B|nr:chalcone isomerase family protein [Pelomonas sp. SE-A7]MDM4765152.1 chalcone isomerase family protein [Pelomonas sp. SE-A7]
MKLTRRALLLSGAATTLPSWAKRFEDHDFADEIQLGGSTLVLNGTGLFSKFGFRGYLTALYLSRKADTAEAVFANAGPKRIQMRMLMGVGVEELIKPIHKGVARNCTPEEQQLIAARLPALIHNIELVGKLRKGDLINMDHVPQQGTQLSVNGKAFGAPAPGNEPMLALLKVFLGAKPTNDRLKAGMLDQPIP